MLPQSKHPDRKEYNPEDEHQEDSSPMKRGSTHYENSRRAMTRTASPSSTIT